MALGCLCGAVTGFLSIGGAGKANEILTLTEGIDEAPSFTSEANPR